MKYPILLLSLLLTFAACSSSEEKKPQDQNPAAETPAEKPQPTPQVQPTTPGEMAKPPLDASSLTDLEWMIGTWKQEENPQTASYETWRKDSDQHFTGAACTIQNGDTVWKESLEIAIENGKAIYFATVPENDGAVGFTMTGKETERVDFENPEHDFPWKITYWRGADTLYARVAGFRNGQAAFNDLVMLRVDE